MLLFDFELAGFRWYRLGADFADALHLAHTKSLPFYTFDERFCKKAIREGIAPAINIL